MPLQYFLILATLIALLDYSLSWGQSPQANSSVINAWKENPEVRECGVCHFSPGNDFAARETDFCRLIEAKLWLNNDKHAISRRRIEPLIGDKPDWIASSNRLSYAIVNRLGYEVETEVGYAQFRDNCLTCHAGYQGHDESREFEKSSSNRPGISCNFCHQIGNDTRWIDEHSGFNAKLNWRTSEPKLKAEKGMRNLVTIENQAELCLKCHVGDIKQNMFVTHQIYAAGHPPLPSVELGALLDAMPRHWRTNTELYQSLENYRDRGLYFKRALGGAIDNDRRPIDQMPWQSQTIAVGAIAAYQQSLTNIEQAASPNSKHWGDYALFDCAACHHELKVLSPRQSVRVGSTPGRPRLAEWPQAISDAALKSVDDDSETTNAKAALHRAVEEKPFGNRALVALRAGELKALILRCQTRLNKESLTSAFANRFLVSLTQTSEMQLIDYHAARQVNWALRGIDAELTRLQTPLPGPVRHRIGKLGIVSGVVRVESKIPGGQTQEIFPTFVDAELKRQSEYDSQQFHLQLKSVFDTLR